MEDMFRFADDLGPFKIIHIYEPSINLKAILVVDNIARGPAIGGVICAAMEYHGASESAVLEAIAEKIRRNTDIVLRSSMINQIMPREAAREMALERVRKAMGYRRWNLFSSSSGYL